MYKYIGTEDGAQGYKHSSNDIFVRGFPKDLKPEIKGRRIYRLCNPPEDINLGSEGMALHMFVALCYFPCPTSLLVFIFLLQLFQVR